ncbi:glycosyltransferase family 1 protein [Christiangramia fulva]|uniref:Glycosyltransferase family 1 protein n=2 Tax=Christiangramia fulva TaxID=2126553 RepID=A0A2R3ZB29_9FLAO|nr:glycosyltransferase family 1 protein [Christiangramia fulva]
MNILQVSSGKKVGGGQKQLENLCLELNELDKEVKTFILCIKNSDFEKYLSKKDLEFDSAPLSFNLDPRFLRKIISIVKEKKIDLIHIHGSAALTLCIIATKLAKLPPFVFSKKTSFPIKNRKQTLYKYNHPNLKKILCVSETTRKIASESIKDHSKLVRVYHGSRIKNTDPPFDLRKKLNISEDKIIVGTIANHIRAKNLETWVATIAEIINIRKYENFHFVQIGSFTSRTENLQEEIKSKGLEASISMLGFVEEASALIPQFDISLLTSQSEGLPQFIFESFFYKTPVVSTAVGGIPEIIKDGENGFLTEPFNSEQLADKLIALQENPELGKKFSERSHKIFLNNFTSRKMAENTLAEYKKVINGKV